MVNGNLTICFATAEIRKAYVDMLSDQPNLHVPLAPADQDDRGG